MTLPSIKVNKGELAACFFCCPRSITVHPDATNSPDQTLTGEKPQLFSINCTLPVYKGSGLTEKNAGLAGNEFTGVYGAPAHEVRL